MIIMLGEFIEGKIFFDSSIGYSRFCLAVLKFIEMLVIIFIQHEQDFPENVTGILSRNQCKQDEKDLIEKLTTFVLSQQSSQYDLSFENDLQLICLV